MADPIKINLYDVFGRETFEDHIEAEVYVGEHNNVSGIFVYLRQPGDELDFACVVVELNGEQPRLIAYNTRDMDSEPTVNIRLDEGYGEYCMQCGGVWGTHNGDGSCVEED